MHRIFLTILLCCTVLVANAGKPFIVSPNIEKAYNKVVDFKFNEAKEILKKEKAANPDNMMTPFIENYIDYLTVVVEMDASVYKKLKVVKEKRLQKIKNEGDMLSPYYLYVQAEMKMQWASLQIVFGEYYATVKGLKHSYKLLEENQKRYPNFVANKKTIGYLNIIFSSIPDSYQWAANLFGIKGSFHKGVRDVESVIRYSEKNKFLFDREIRVIYAYLLLHVGNSEKKAWTLMTHPSIKEKDSRGILLLKSVIAMRTGHNQEAISILSNRPKSAVFVDIPQLEFYLGKAKMMNLDPTAISHFKKYVQDPNNKHFVKASYHYIAWHYAVNNDFKTYNTYVNLAKTKGINKFYDDNKAMEEIEKEDVPNPTLLKARLLYDGGNFKRSEQLLAKTNINSFDKTSHKIEFIYRRARIAESLNKPMEAIKFYDQTILTDKEQTSQYSCKSALNVAIIYENKKDYTKATIYYKKCLSLNPNRYKFSLHQKAKAGLNRIKKI